MPFPLPLDSYYRIQIIQWWLEDVDDRLALGRVEDAVISFGIARDLYLKLPCNVFYQALEDRVVAAQGKINQTNSPNP